MRLLVLNFLGGFQTRLLGMQNNWELPLEYSLRSEEQASVISSTERRMFQSSSIPDINPPHGYTLERETKCIESAIAVFELRVVSSIGVGFEGGEW